jgi:hypothetical protein
MTTIETTFHFGRGARTEKRLCVGVAPARGRIPRIAKLMALAIQCDDLLNTAAVKTLAELATLGHVSRTRMTHIMNLVLLAPEIQEHLLHLPRVVRGPDPIYLKDLQPVARQFDWAKQRKAFRRMAKTLRNVD